MPAVELKREPLEAASKKLSGRGPVHMVNLLRYRAQAEYGPDSEFAACSGKDAYRKRYVPAFAEVAQKVAGANAFRVAYLGNVEATLVASAEEAWDDIVIVEYPSFEVMRRISESPEYTKLANPHRLAAIEDWRFLATLKVELGR